MNHVKPASEACWCAVPTMGRAMVGRVRKAGNQVKRRGSVAIGKAEGSVDGSDRAPVDGESAGGIDQRQFGREAAREAGLARAGAEVHASEDVLERGRALAEGLGQIEDHRCVRGGCEVVLQIELQ